MTFHLIEDTLHNLNKIMNWISTLELVKITKTTEFSTQLCCSAAAIHEGLVVIANSQQSYFLKHHHTIISAFDWVIPGMINAWIMNTFDRESERKNTSTCICTRRLSVCLLHNELHWTQLVLHVLFFFSSFYSFQMFIRIAWSIISLNLPSVRP